MNSDHTTPSECVTMAERLADQLARHLGVSDNMWSELRDECETLKAQLRAEVDKTAAGMLREAALKAELEDMTQRRERLTDTNKRQCGTIQDMQAELSAAKATLATMPGTDEWYAHWGETPEDAETPAHGRMVDTGPGTMLVGPNRLQGDAKGHIAPGPCCGSPADETPDSTTYTRPVDAGIEGAYTATDDACKCGKDPCVCLPSLDGESGEKVPMQCNGGSQCAVAKRGDCRHGSIGHEPTWACTQPCTHDGGVGWSVCVCVKPPTPQPDDASHEGAIWAATKRCGTQFRGPKERRCIFVEGHAGECDHGESEHAKPADNDAMAGEIVEAICPYLAARPGDYLWTYVGPKLMVSTQAIDDLHTLISATLAGKGGRA